MTLPPWRQLAAYLLVIAVMAGGLWRVETTANRAESAAAVVDREVADRLAAACVTAWETREDARDGVERATNAGAEAIIAVADGDPLRIKAYRAAVADQAQLARDEISNPDCDIEAARRVLRRSDG